MMIALALLLALSSCSANWHLKKAIAKNPALLTEGKVIERVTDTLEVYIPDTTFTVEVTVPGDTMTNVAPLSKIIASGVMTFENERQIVTIEIDAENDQMRLKSTSKGFTMPASVKLLGRQYKVPLSYDRVTIRPEVRTRHGPWIVKAIIFVLGLFIGFRMKHP